MQYGWGGRGQILGSLAVLLVALAGRAAAVTVLPPAPAATSRASTCVTGADAIPAADGVAVYYLQPLGHGLSPADLVAVQEALAGFYGLEVRILPPRDLPEAAWYAPRARYRAERLMEAILADLPADGLRILGITDRDISTSRPGIEDWGVVGLASYDDPVGVISSFRCGRGASGESHARARLAKVAIHEIGHTLGLPHCPDPACVMRDAEGKVTSSDRALGLCLGCRERLRATGWILPDGPGYSLVQRSMVSDRLPAETSAVQQSPVPNSTLVDGDVTPATVTR